MSSAKICPSASVSKTRVVVVVDSEAKILSNAVSTDNNPDPLWLCAIEHTRFAARFMRQAYRANFHAPVNCLAHIINC